MTITNRKIILIFIFLLSYPIAVYSAMNFEGSVIDFKDVPTSAWRFGIKGNKWIVTVVNAKSHAKQIGFNQGDIIISIDDKNVLSKNDFLGLSTGEHNFKVLNNKYQVENIILTVFPTKKETNKQNDTESTLPAIVVNDDVLSRKYGKSEVNKNTEKRSYQECMDDELANGSTYEFYVNKPNARGGDYGRAQKICDKEFKKRTGTAIERLY